MTNITEAEKWWQYNRHRASSSGSVVIPFRRFTSKSYSKNRVFLATDVDIDNIDSGNNLYSFIMYPF